jgi:hypothetical protein
MMESGCLQVLVEQPLLMEPFFQMIYAISLIASRKSCHRRKKIKKPAGRRWRILLKIHLLLEALHGKIRTDSTFEVRNSPAH